MRNGGERRSKDIGLRSRHLVRHEGGATDMCCWSGWKTGEMRTTKITFTETEKACSWIRVRLWKYDKVMWIAYQVDHSLFLEDSLERWYGPSVKISGRTIYWDFHPDLKFEFSYKVIGIWTGRCTSFAKFLDPDVMFVHIFLPSWYLLRIVDRCIIIFSKPESTFHRQKTSGKRSRDQGRDQGPLRADLTPRGWQKWTRKPKPRL